MRLFNKEKFLKKVEELGMTMVAVADKSGILRQTLYNRLENGDFKISEIAALTKVLRLTRKERDEIFFAKEVN